MNERHFRRSQKEMAKFVNHPGCGEAGGYAQRNPQIGLPGSPTELTPPDLEGLLPAEILRLFVRQDLLGIDLRVDDLQFCQTITSFSSSTP
jgi:hypothetical protein